MQTINLDFALAQILFDRVEACIVVAAAAAAALVISLMDETKHISTNIIDKSHSRLYFAHFIYTS